LTLDRKAVRAQFPALDQPAIFLDNPGGTQVPHACMDRIRRYYLECNANHGGNFYTSRVSDAMVHDTRVAMAQFLNAASPDEIVFGHNMTTLTLHMSRSLGREFKPGSTIVVTRMDHDGNISPWLLLAEDRGFNIRWVDFNPETGMLDLDDMQAAIADKPALVAVGYASNGLGTVNPVGQITRWAHEAGAMVYIDAVQYGAHGGIDVQKLDADFLVCSAYKFFGPHMGILYGKREHLERLTPYKVRPAPDNAPDRWETGTGNFEHISGLYGTLEYFEWLGRTYGEEYYERFAGEYEGRPLTFKMAAAALHAYEMELNRHMLETFQSIPGAHVYGITDKRYLDQRVPTFTMTIDGWHPEKLATLLGEKGIYTWDGNFYALEITKRLGLEDKGGLLRIGAVHYNTLDEIKRTGEALREIIS